MVKCGGAGYSVVWYGQVRSGAVWYGKVKIILRGKNYEDFIK